MRSALELFIGLVFICIFIAGSMYGAYILTNSFTHDIQDAL